MNDVDRETLNRLIGGISEVKAEIVGIGVHLSGINGSITKHFADDAEWQRTHDLAEAKAKGYRAGALALASFVVAAASFAASMAANWVH